MEEVLWGKAYYLGSGRGKSDIDSYREALTGWKKLRVKLDAELVPLPWAHDAEYDDVIREWELVLGWSMQNEAGDEAVVAREKLADLRARREKPRQPPVGHDDRFSLDRRLGQAVPREGTTTGQRG